MLKYLTMPKPKETTKTMGFHVDPPMTYLIKENRKTSRNKMIVVISNTITPCTPKYATMNGFLSLKHDVPNTRKLYCHIVDHELHNPMFLREILDPRRWDSQLS